MLNMWHFKREDKIIIITNRVQIDKLTGVEDTNGLIAFISCISSCFPNLLDTILFNFFFLIIS